jgi:hypothetical protein
MATIQTVIIGFQEQERVELDASDTLASLRRAIRCDVVDCVGLDEGIDLWCDDEGAINGSPLNLMATIAAHTLGVPAVLFGRVVAARVDERGRTVGLTDKQATRVLDIIRDKPAPEVLDRLIQNLGPHPFAAMLQQVRQG